MRNSPSRAVHSKPLTIHLHNGSITVNEAVYTAEHINATGADLNIML